MALSADVNVNRYVDQQLRTLSVKAATVIYRGALVGLDRATGYARPILAGDQFQGLAYEHCDNGGGANGDREVTLFTQGDFEMALAGVTKVSIGRPVFATGDNVLTLSGGAASYVGVIVDVPVVGTVIVRIDPQRRLTKTASVPLSSSTSADTRNAVACFGVPVVIVRAMVWFETKPGSGNLDVGTDASDPDELVDAFSLATLSNGVASNLALAGTAVAANTRIWAKVSQGSTAGVGGGLALEYFELP